MALLAPPPPPPRVSTSHADEPDWMRLRMYQAGGTFATVLGTAWVCTLGPIPAIIALSVAKHVLVAILMSGLGVDAPRRQRR